METERFDKNVARYYQSLERGHRIRWAIGNSYQGVVTAAALYPIVTTLVMLIIRAAHYIAQGTPNELLDLVIHAANAIVLLTIGCVFLITLFWMLASWIVLFLNWTTGYIFGPRLSAAMVGCLSGYLPTCWIVVVLLNEHHHLDWEFIAVAVHLPLAMLAGQIGAIWSARMQGRPGGLVASTDEPRYQFQIRHILVLTAWAAGVFAINEACYENTVLLLVVFWVVTQTILIGLDRLWYQVWTVIRKKSVESSL